MNDIEDIDEHKMIKASERAMRAEALLNDELLVEAFARVDSELIDLWRQSKDPAARDRIWQATQIAERVRVLLNGVVQNGKVAKAHLAAIEGRRSRAKAA